VKKTYVLSGLLFLGLSQIAFGQVGIGTTAPEESARLDITATDKGMLIPRVSLTSTTDISTVINPAISLLVYNTATTGDVTPGFYYYDGSKWVTFVIGNNASQLSKWTNDGANNVVKLRNSSDGSSTRDDSDNIFISDEGNLGIGKIPERGLLEMVSDSPVAGSDNDVLLSSYDNTNNHTRLILSRYRGSLSSPSEVQNWDHLGSLSFRGAVSSDNAISLISSRYRGDGTSLRTDLSIGTSNRANDLYIDPDGNIGLSETSPSAKLDVFGDVAISDAPIQTDMTGKKVVIRNNSTGGIETINTNDLLEDAASKWTNDGANNVVGLTNNSDGTTARADENNLFITDNGRLGLGMKPVRKFDIVVDNRSDLDDDFRISTYTNSHSTPGLSFFKAKGAKNNPQALDSNDFIGSVRFIANSNAGNVSSGIYSRYVGDGSNKKTNLFLGTSDRIEDLVIDEDGNIEITRALTQTEMIGKKVVIRDDGTGTIETINLNTLSSLSNVSAINRQTGDYSMTNSDEYVLVAPTAATTINLPTNPEDGQRVTIKKINNTSHNVTLNPGSGKTIEGQSNRVLSVAFQFNTLIYLATDNMWFLVNQ
jgi:hypothetical protein